jgi:predicted methyltransferase MtxX (methanogen marker protein 4)
MYGLTVLVVDGEEQSRTRLLLCLRRLGLRALGVVLTMDAVALLDALDADVTVVHNDDDEEAMPMALLRKRSQVVKFRGDAPVEEVVVELLRVLGRPEAAALRN